MAALMICPPPTFRQSLSGGGAETSVCAECEIAGTGHGTRRATSLDHHVRRFGWTCVYTYDEAKPNHFLRHALFWRVL